MDKKYILNSDHKLVKHELCIYAINKYTYLFHMKAYYIMMNKYIKYMGP